MISRDVVRQQPAVQNFDHTAKLEEYGLSVGTRADLDKAKDLIDGMVLTADGKVDKVIGDLMELDQNPYKRMVTFNGSEIKYALEVPLFADGELTKQIANDFPQGGHVPKIDVMAKRLVEGLVAKAVEAKYEVIGVEPHPDGTPLRIVLRDPQYVADALQRDTGLAATAPVASLSDLTASLVEQATTRRTTASTEALGCDNLDSGEKILAARACIKDIVDAAVLNIVTQMDTLRVGQVSPFRDTPYLIAKDEPYIDHRLITRRGFWRERFIDRPIILEAINTQEIRAELERHIGTKSAEQVNIRTYSAYVRAEVMEHLKKQHGLPLAGMVYEANHYSGRQHEKNDKLLVILTDPTLERQPGLLTKILTLGTAKPKPMLALAAPAALALPAPAVAPDADAPAPQPAPQAPQAPQRAAATKGFALSPNG